MLAQALMGTVERLDISRMQLGQLLLELPYLQTNKCPGQNQDGGQPSYLQHCMVSHLRLQFLDLLPVFCCLCICHAQRAV